MAMNRTGWLSAFTSSEFRWIFSIFAFLIQATDRSPRVLKWASTACFSAGVNWSRSWS